MSLLRVQLVVNNHWFPYMDSEPGTHRIDDQVADQSLQSINHEYKSFWCCCFFTELLDNIEPV